MSDMHSIAVPRAFHEYAEDRCLRFVNSTYNNDKISWTRDEVLKLTTSCFVSGWLDWALAQTGKVTPSLKEIDNHG